MYYQFKGLVLRAEIAAEADKRVIIYTDTWGKIWATVPGAKKIRAKFAAATEPVTESEFMVYLASPSARAKVTGARIRESFAELKKDWRRLAVAQYCSEIAEVLTPYNAENILKYNLIQRTWELLGTAGRPWRIYAAFVLRFLKLSGYSFTEFLKYEKGVATQQEMDVLQKLATLSGDDVDRNLDIPAELERRARQHLDQYLNQYLPRPLAAREFWQKIEISSSKLNEKVSSKLKEKVSSKLKVETSAESSKL